jgi:post-segregation antitoxin (ccd killing protein)
LLRCQDLLTTPDGPAVPPMPRLWYKDGMARVRISTTVDEQLLAAARETRSGVNDSALIDEALDALLARNRAVEIDVAYTAYDRLPLDAGDEWGDLASFRAAAGSS